MTDFTKTRAWFHLPEGMIYLDGNSLGPLPVTAAARVAQALQDEWGQMLITGWNKAGWMAQPGLLGDRIGRLIGAEPGHVVLGDTLSIKVFQALAAALNINERGKTGRKVILSDSGNFPTDLYMAEGLLSLLEGYELRIVAPEQVAKALTDEIAVTLLTEVDYRTGRLHDMAALTAQAHVVGALTVWDLAHSAGAFEVDLAGCRADFAVGCTYKYLNAGPGSPAFIYVNPTHADQVEPALAGWLGHRAPFAFDLEYQAGQGIDRMRVGTPPVLQMAALEAALEVWDSVDMADVRAASIALSEQFIEGIESNCPELILASPRDPNQRGSQVSFHFHEGYAAMQAVIARGVIGDFRAPDIMRFGFCPLYVGASDIETAVSIISDVMQTSAWDNPAYKVRSAVT